MQELFEIGKITSVHGIVGEVKALPLTDSPERYRKLTKVLVGDDHQLKEYTIESVRFIKNLVIIKFKEISDRDAAEKLRGAFIKIHRKDAVKLPADAFFICDLIDCEVINTEGKSLGHLKDVLKTGSNDVYVVRTEDGREILVPALKSVVKSVSVEDRKMIVELPEGLVDDEI